jgi:hypothetical protein
MSARMISPIICAIVAAAIGACSGDTSMPTDPAHGSGLNRPMPSQDTANGGTVSAAPTDPQAPGSPGNPPPPPGPTQQRPLYEFLKAQGTYCVDDGMGGCQLYAAPVANYLAWFDQATGSTIGIDYAGIANAWMMQNMGRSNGTQIDGSITEQPLADGTVQVTVDLKADNAMAFVLRGPDLNGAVTYGARPQDLGDPRMAPALGSAHVFITFINTAPGAPLPDLVQLIRKPQAGQKLISIRVQYAGNGQTGPGYEFGPGQPATMTLAYDSSQQPMMPANPAAPGSTPPTGYANMSLQQQAQQ